MYHVFIFLFSILFACLILIHRTLQPINVTLCWKTNANIPLTLTYMHAQQSHCKGKHSEDKTEQNEQTKLISWEAEREREREWIGRMLEKKCQSIIKVTKMIESSKCIKRQQEIVVIQIQWPMTKSTDQEWVWKRRRS